MKKFTSSVLPALLGIAAMLGSQSEANAVTDASLSIILNNDNLQQSKSQH
jgi:hypothetical protein